VRALITAESVLRFMRSFGAAAETEGTCYLVGGASAVLLGWRETTVDIDIALEPEQDAALRALPGIKHREGINVELASPADFIPLPAGWRARSLSVGREGHLVFAHFDLYSQALAKLERGHERDLQDVAALLSLDLVEAGRLRQAYEEIEPELYRFPAIDPDTFRMRVEAATS
jgi:hypothetical protein